MQQELHKQLATRFIERMKMLNRDNPGNLNKEEQRLLNINKLNLWYESVFLFQTDLMSEYFGVCEERILRYRTISTANSKNPNFQVFQLAGLNNNDDFLPCLEEITLLISKTVERIHFMNPSHPMFEFHDDIWSSINWHKKLSPSYSMKQNVTDHVRWFSYYLEIMQSEITSPYQLSQTNRKVYNFYANLAKGAIVLNDWKIDRAIEIILKVSSTSRQKPRIPAKHAILEKKYKTMIIEAISAKTSQFSDN